ncbi:MAG: lactate utilization protein [Ardenticatenia bacterium]|nr:lactate utilization protein [Ardenticatenia bacterium]
MVRCRPQPGDVRAFAASADVGVSGVEAALAETGTVVVRSGPGRSRLATLLPPVHVAFVPFKRLTVDLFTWLGRRPDPMPANLVFISGPSKTADIEQTLAVGVHGPVRFIVVLYP